MPATGDDHSEGQRRRLRRRAGLLGFAESLLVLAPIYYGFRPPPVAVFVLVLALPLILVFVNVWTVDVMSRDAPPPTTMPKIRDGFGLAVAVVVGFATVSWIFSDDFERAQMSTEAPAWNAQIQRLESERSVKLKFVGQDPRSVDQDPEVLRLQYQIDEAEKALLEAKRNVLCEQDGTCGTGVRGKGQEYFDKVEYRDQIERRIRDLKNQLASAKEVAKDRVDKTSGDSQTAKTRVAEIDGQLERLRSNPPRSRDWFSALTLVSKEKPALILVWIGVLMFFLVVDLVGLRAVPWQMYRRVDRSSLEANLVAQAEIDDRRAHGAKPYPQDGE